ncbi:hypothetical protein PR001_g15973 [Phytophthora rubi]|uniref:Uncharacterized protein n=2 Tax=Phytophthora rubi TaxID=129364 RepID=A0A6A3KWJ0_9STRA|nr:hypothetical protein PR001_g15973 [Phytophthora rubi]
MLGLQQCGMIWLRGDLMPADTKQAQAHCFVCLKSIKQKPDATEAVVFRSFMCTLGTRLSLPVQSSLCTSDIAQRSGDVEVEEEKDDHIEEGDQSDPATSKKVDEDSEEEREMESSNSKDDSGVTDEVSVARIACSVTGRKAKALVGQERWYSTQTRRWWHPSDKQIETVTI